MTDIAIGFPFTGTYRVTQKFGVNPQNYPRYNGHNGIDWGTPNGTRIIAPHDGVIVRCGWDKPGSPKTGYGIHIRMDLGGGWGYILGHFKEIYVEVGQQVHTGDLLGLSDDTGWSTGPHLHEELRRGLTPVDQSLYRLAVGSQPAVITPTPTTPPPDTTTPNVEVAVSIPAGKAVTVTATDGLALRSTPSKADGSNLLVYLREGVQLEKLETVGEWVKVACYVKRQWIR